MTYFHQLFRTIDGVLSTSCGCNHHSHTPINEKELRPASHNQFDQENFWPKPVIWPLPVDKAPSSSWDRSSAGNQLGSTHALLRRTWIKKIWKMTKKIPRLSLRNICYQYSLSLQTWWSWHISSRIREENHQDNEGWHCLHLDPPLLPHGCVADPEKVHMIIWCQLHFHCFFIAKISHHK